MDTVSYCILAITEDLSMLLCSLCYLSCVDSGTFSHLVHQMALACMKVWTGCHKSCLRNQYLFFLFFCFIALLYPVHMLTSTRLSLPVCWSSVRLLVGVYRILYLACTLRSLFFVFTFYLIVKIPALMAVLFVLAFFFFFFFFFCVYEISLGAHASTSESFFIVD